jgi:hypothetical protein
MNSDEQRERRTAILNLKKEMKELEDSCADVIEEAVRGFKQTVEDTRSQFMQDVARHEDIVRELLASLDAKITLFVQDLELADSIRRNEIENLISVQTKQLRRTFWGRLRWVFTGR